MDQDLILIHKWQFWLRPGICVKYFTHNPGLRRGNHEQICDSHALLVHILTNSLWSKFDNSSKVQNAKLTKLFRPVFWSEELSLFPYKSLTLGSRRENSNFAVCCEFYIIVSSTGLPFKWFQFVLQAGSFGQKLHFSTHFFSLCI